MREQGLGLLQTLADLDSIGKHDFTSLLFDPINLSRDDKWRTFNNWFIHFDSRPFGNFNYSIRRRASDGEIIDETGIQP